jgi:carboxylate-amine ligase
VPEEVFDGSRRQLELFESMLELTTGVRSTAEEVLAELGELRREAAGALEPHGLSLLAAGTHPLADPERQHVRRVPELQDFMRYGGPAVRVQVCCGVHVHVAVESADACLVAIESVLPWLPALLALSSNSPYFDGRETGYASTRAEILSRLPRSGAPPPYRTLEEWEAFARRLVALGLADDYRRIWWDVRPHPRLGTVEIRIADQPTDVALSAAVAGLLQAMVVGATRRAPVDRAVYAQNRFAALRFGASAELIHPDGTRLATPSELLAELIEEVEPVSRRLGSDRLVAELPAVARRTQADAQLARGRAEGLRALCTWLAERTQVRE